MRILVSLVLLLVTSACTFSSTAEHWNGVNGSDGEPVYAKSTTNVGVNLAVFLPILGSTTLDNMVNRLTDEIAARGGDHIQLFQTTSENYWYGFPPLTWVLTPVITTVSAEYRPSEAERAATRKRDAR